MPDVDVVIVSHNYGEYLGEAIESVLAQTKLPKDILVVADSSTDNTLSVAKAHDIRTLSVNHRNCYLSRKSGLENTSSEFIMFLDADDKIEPNYIEKCIKHFENYPKCGVVSSNIVTFGNKIEKISPKPSNMQQNNWIHCASLARRTALVSSCAYESKTPPTLDMCEDWFVWRRVDRDGWSIGRIPDYAFHYRQHANQMTSSTRHYDYYSRGALEYEPITLVLPVCRDKYVPRLAKWVLENQEYFTNLLIIDSTKFKGETFNRLIENSIENFDYISLPTADADAPRFADDGGFTRVQTNMTRIYRHLRKVTTEYMLILEDDVLPPNNIIKALMHGMDKDIASVSAVVPCRQKPGKILSGMKDMGLLPFITKTGIQDVQYNSFSCLLLRNSVVKQLPPPSTTGHTSYDSDFSKTIDANGYRQRLNYNVVCEHGGL